MKSSEFKKIVKSAVREAIQEELKDILFEAFKSQKGSSPITENFTPIDNTVHQTIPQPSFNPTSQPLEMSAEERRAKYEEALNGTQLSFTSNDVQNFNPQPGADAINGSLGEGSVSMDQITSLMGR